jgi:hypothetical protein
MGNEQANSSGIMNTIIKHEKVLEFERSLTFHLMERKTCIDNKVIVVVLACHCCSIGIIWDKRRFGHAFNLFL